MTWGLSEAAGVSIPVDYAVSEAGAATLSIPIEVPRGIGGMEPQLALSYSSDAGNGLLGLGWVLTGPSTISRCPQNLVNDGVRGKVDFSENDRFCLDGQRLLLVSGTYGADGASYRTFPESFSRITSLGRYVSSNGSLPPNVPATFMVETKAGLIMEYGLTDNSRIPTNFGIMGEFKPSTINRWMLQRISDRTANKSFMEFVYCRGTINNGTCDEKSFKGAAVLHYIRYTNRNGQLNGENAVLFSYESRPDAVTIYRAGSIATQSYRLKKIETYVNFGSPAAPGTLVKSYELNYESPDSGGVRKRMTSTSRLQSLVQRGNGIDALPAVTFTMSDDGIVGSAAPSTSVGSDRQSVQSGACGGVTRIACR